jgi:uncharacterized membrane protein YcaP (DUF421 family)
MKPEEIKLNDWARIIFGSVPAEFYIELVIRAALVYFILMVSMRFLGKRMSTQLSRLELTAMVSLAAAIGVPMLSQTNGILPAFIIAAIIVGFTRLISFISVRKQKFEKITQGDIDILIEDGVLHTNIMQKVRITRDRLFAQLRKENILHTGMVKRLYMEPNGAFTLIENQQPNPGLIVLPAWDKEFIKEKLQRTDVVICNNCAETKPEHLAHLNGEARCPKCHAHDWTKAVAQRVRVTSDERKTADSII